MHTIVYKSYAMYRKLRADAWKPGMVSISGPWVCIFVNRTSGGHVWQVSWPLGRELAGLRQVFGRSLDPRFCIHICIHIFVVFCSFLSFVYQHLHPHKCPYSNPYLHQDLYSFNYPDVHLKLHPHMCSYLHLFLYPNLRPHPHPDKIHIYIHIYIHYLLGLAP